jgi:hypothetical protein
MTKRQFRTLIVLNWLLTLTVVAAFYSTQSFLPTELKTYLENQKNAPISTSDNILLWIDITLLVFTIAISIALFLFKSWARKLFIIGYIISVLLIPTRPVYIDTGWTHLIFNLGNIIGGMILALVYFSPVSRLFGVPEDV